MPRGYNEWADIREFLVPPGQQLATIGGVANVDLARLWQLFSAQIDILNRDRDPLLNLLTFPVNTPIEQMVTPVIEAFEPASEYGTPKGIRQQLQPVTWGYSFAWFDIGTRYTWQFLLDATAEYLVSLNDTVMAADVQNQFTQVFRAVFNNTNRTSEIYQQAINVYPFLNADGFVPPPYKTTTHAGTHTHYLTTNHAAGGAGPDSGDLEAMADHLAHHGFKRTDGYQLVLMVNPQEGAKIRTFQRGLDSQPDAGTTALPLYDFIPSPAYGGGLIVPAGMQVIGGPTPGDPGLGPSFNWVGSYGPWAIVEDDFMPASYMFGWATGGEQDLRNPVGIREHTNPAGRGLQLVNGPDREYPIRESYYVHGFGTGIRRREQGVIMQVKSASTTYDIPAAYV